MRRKTAIVLASLIVLAAAAFSGGTMLSTGGSDSERGAVEVGAVANPLLRGPRAHRPYIVKSNDLIAVSSDAPSVARYPNGHDNDEVSATGAVPINPCGLVSRGAATGLLGGAVGTTLEPQGPTCVYAMPGSKGQITMVVDDTPLRSLRRQAKRATRVSVAGRTGWCLRYASTSVAVAFSRGHVLHVTGPCGTATRFAAVALSHARH
jgi:hypothetical protein